jgi:hypothetical protein
MRHLVLLGLCICLAPHYLAAAQRQTMVARAASVAARYTSARYGYSILVPSGWVRVPNVHWTPGAAGRP